MIRAVFYRDSEDNMLGFEIKGHAGYAENGRDIICASVSALAINTVNAVENLTSCRFRCEQKPSGLLRFKFLSDSELTSEQKKQGQLLLNALSLGIESISREYGEGYVQVHYKEV